MNSRSNPDPGGRFSFGKNWAEFLRSLDDNKIGEAERSLVSLLGLPRLDGLSFLDIGSGSGLFSLAARRLGARVCSFDFDVNSVSCATHLRERFFPGDPSWSIARGSVLDTEFMATLGTHDIVYSWGVLHHTGYMYDAMRSAASRVAHGGVFAFALYRKTHLCWVWKIEKRWYANTSPKGQKIAQWLAARLFRLSLPREQSFEDYVANYASLRGMDYYRDLHDWLGGYPYESITPDEVAEVMARLGLEHVRSNVQASALGIHGSGCDEYVYRRSVTVKAAPAGVVIA